MWLARPVGCICHNSIIVKLHSYKMQPKGIGRWVGRLVNVRNGLYNSTVLFNIFNTIKTTIEYEYNQCLSLVPNMGVVASACLPVSVIALYIIQPNLIHSIRGCFNLKDYIFIV